MSGLYPGSAAALNDHAKLFEAKEWAVLAALVLRAGDTGALGTLASAADDWRAFAWMWAVFNQDNPRHCQEIGAGLAAGVAVPENLHDAVSSFVLSRIPPAVPGHALGHRQLTGEHLARRAAQEKVLASLDPRTDHARELALAVLDDEEGRYWPGLRHAAFDVLGAARKKAVRSHVFGRAAGLPPPDRLRPLLGLAPPYLKGEEAEIAAALKEALPVSGPFPVGGSGPDEYWSLARKLAARLGAPNIEGVLGEPWARNGTDLTNFLGGGFVGDLGTEKLEALLASSLDEAVRRHLIQAASAELPIEALAELGRWTHQNLDPEWSQPLRDRLSDYARPSRHGPRSPHQEAALRTLRNFQQEDHRAPRQQRRHQRRTAGLRHRADPGLLSDGLVQEGQDPLCVADLAVNSPAYGRNWDGRESSVVWPAS